MQKTSGWTSCPHQGDVVLFGDVARRIIDSLAWVCCPPTGKHGVVDHPCQVQLTKLFRRTAINPALEAITALKSQ